MEIRETPFVLIARVMVKSGKVEEYMKIASTVDEAVEKTEPGMLFHHFDSDPANELKFVWTEIYKNDEALIFHINNPPVGEYVEKHLELAESIEIEIYGQLADDTIDILTAGAQDTAGKVRVWAVLCDISGSDETASNSS